jgi:hypothetical protein
VTRPSATLAVIPQVLRARSMVKAFFLILCPGEIRYAWPFFGAMARSGAIFWSTPLEKML